MFVVHDCKRESTSIVVAIHNVDIGQNERKCTHPPNELYGLVVSARILFTFFRSLCVPSECDEFTNSYARYCSQIYAYTYHTTSSNSPPKIHLEFFVLRSAIWEAKRKKMKPLHCRYPHTEAMRKPYSQRQKSNRRVCVYAAWSQAKTLFSRMSRCRCRVVFASACTYTLGINKSARKVCHSNR